MLGNVNFNTWFILLLVGGWLFSSCPSQPSCKEFEGTYYTFRLPIEIQPNLDTIASGTRIELVSEFTENVYDEVAERTYLLEDFNFYPFIVLSGIDTFPTDDGFLNCTENMQIDAEEWTLIEHSDESSSLVFKFIRMNGEYRFNASFRILKPGTYFLQAASNVSLFDQHQDFPGKCRDRIVNPVFRMNLPDMENNFHLLEVTEDPRIMLIDKAHFDEWGGYAFVVIE